MRLLACLLLLALPLSAEATPSLRDAFHAAVKVRKAENELKLLQALDDGSAIAAAAQEKSAAQLTQARIAFHSVLLADAEELEAWQAQLLREKSRPARSGRVLASLATMPVPASFQDPRHLAFLKAYLPEARAFSALEWQMITEWFGAGTQEAFLSWAFSLTEIQPEKSSVPSGVLLVEGAWRSPAGSTERELARELGASVMRLSAFEKTEEQAEDLKRQLLARTEPVVLVTTGEASAVVLAMLDLFPALRQHASLRGWVNVDGQLYGQGKLPAGRVPASVEQHVRADKDRMQLESLERPTPLGPGFPIVNLVSLGKGRPAPGSLRASLVAEGTSLFVKEAPAWRALSSALRQLSATPPRP